VPIVELVPDTAAGAGSFTLQGAGRRQPAANGRLRPARRRAMVLHTSGTTSRPKIVPLSQEPVRLGRQHPQHAEVHARGPGLNIMPLFHIHGLIAGVLAPLGRLGGVLHAGLRCAEVLRLDGRGHPTWYTAVPTMHQAILTRASAQQGSHRANPLRFLRSSSSSIPPQVITELEAVFGAPLIEAYGMTEATHQMASNPLPPATRKPGSVGLPGRARSRDHGRGRQPAAAGEHRRDRDPRRQRHRRLREQPQGQCRRLHQRLVPHRRPGRHGQRRLCVADRPPQGDHQPRRRKDFAARVDEI
jgi:acyl-CoA synthetase (AMP-forming)/AMP-acid ligase II